MKKHLFFVSMLCFLSTYVYAAEFQINSYTTNAQRIPNITYGSTNYLVTWHSELQDGSSHGIYGQIVSPTGSRVGSELQINTYTTDRQSYSELSYDGTNYLVVWSSNGQDGQENGIYGQRVSSSGTLLGSEFQVNTYTQRNQEQAAIAYDGTNYLVTWSSFAKDGDSHGIYGQRVSPTGSLVGSEFQINTHTTGHQLSSKLAYDGTNYLVTWQSELQDGDSYGIYGQRVSPTGSLVGSEFQINTHTTSTQNRISLAFGDSSYLVTWSSNGQDGDDLGIYGQLVSPLGALLGTELQINSHTSDEQFASSLFYDGTNYLVVWQSELQDGDSYGIYGQRVSSTGSLVGSEFLINTFTTNKQAQPSVAFDGTNYFAVWESEFQDGDSYGIFGDFIEIAPIPEPSTIILCFAGFMTLFRKILRK